jgi:CDP-glucose 4,6-dehydratase
MESLGMSLFADQYRGRRVFITGHTGFKGSWLALWLTKLGATVVGYSLSPDKTPNHWDLLDIKIPQYLKDIRDSEKVRQAINETHPDIVFHLAAQPLVRRSYLDPLETWSTNVMGTANVLEACRSLPGIRAIIVVTTDKCYENQEWVWGYRENDRLGGHDPYSASKASAELVVSSYRQAFFNQAGSPLLASVRAGNVIGGGDWAEDRLIPDLVRSLEEQKPLQIRAPMSTRPWQHVLESLSGYLLLGQLLLEGHSDKADAWNFGPGTESNLTVLEVLAGLQAHWPELAWQPSDTPQLHEAHLLSLDSAKAKRLLGWKPVWNIDKTLDETASWYRNYYRCRQILSSAQLADYIASAQMAGIGWATT